MHSHHFHRSILREYDVRGTMGTSLSDADGYSLGRALASVIKRDGGSRIAVGRDGRLSSPLLADAVVKGITDAGLTALPIGVGPTPMLYFAVQHLAADAGIMITGSHNPPQDNGFKMALRSGPFYGGAIQELGRIAAEGSWASGQGRVEDSPVFDAYVDRLCVDLAGSANVGWDPGNGAAGEVAQALVKRMAGRHAMINADIDGTFPAHHPDPTEDHNLVQLQELVANEKLDLGLAFDGDGDRLGAIDGSGRIVRADQYMLVLAADLLKEVPGATIVGDVKCSQSLFDSVAKLGGQPLMWKTGHSLVKAKMKETGAPLAGEMSGHIFFAHRYYGFDDGLYAAVRLLGAIHRAGRSLKDLIDALPASFSTPELRVPCPEERKFAIISSLVARLKAQGARISDIDGARVATDDGWWLLRASNTQAVLVARAEATSQAGLDRLLSILDDQLRPEGLSLPAIGAPSH
jgi:phosphomannomutase